MSRTKTKTKESSKRAAHKAEEFPEEARRRGLEEWERRWQEETRQEQERERETAALQKRIHAPLAKLITGDKDAADALRRLRELRARRHEEMSAASKAVADAPRVVTPDSAAARSTPAAASATLTEPYPLALNLAKKIDGDAYADRLYVDKTYGHMGYSKIGSGPKEDRSYCSVNTGFGFAFYPTATNGRLQVSANLHYKYTWGMSCYLQPAHNEGWVGLRFDAFNSTTKQCESSLSPKSYRWKVDGSYYYDNDGGGRTRTTRSHTKSTWTAPTTITSTWGSAATSGLKAPASRAVTPPRRCRSTSTP